MHQPPRFRDTTALVADDSAFTRRIVRELLAQVGIKRVIEAADGAEALSVLLDASPELLLIDWDMPFMNGAEVMRLVRNAETSPNPRLPVILITAIPRRHVVEEAVALGVNEILVKPFSPRGLWDRLNEVINHPRDFVVEGGILRPVPRTAMAA